MTAFLAQRDASGDIQSHYKGKRKNVHLTPAELNGYSIFRSSLSKLPSQRNAFTFLV